MGPPLINLDVFLSTQLSIHFIWDSLQFVEWFSLPLFLFYHIHAVPTTACGARFCNFQLPILVQGENSKEWKDKRYRSMIPWLLLIWTLCDCGVFLFFFCFVSIAQRIYFDGWAANSEWSMLFKVTSKKEQLGLLYILRPPSYTALSHPLIPNTNVLCPAHFRTFPMPQSEPLLWVKHPPTFFPTSCDESVSGYAGSALRQVARIIKAGITF